MTCKATIYATLAAVLATTAMMLLFQVRRERSARLALIAITKQLGPAKVETQRLVDKAAQQEGEKVRLRKALSAAQPIAGTTVTKHSAEQEKIHVKRLFAWLGLRNRPLYSKLRFSPDQIAQYEWLETAYWLRVQDIAGAARDQKLSGSDPVVQSLRKAEGEQFEREVAELFGRSSAEAIREFQRTLPVRTMANALAGNVYNTASPLTTEQGEQLTRILAANSAAYQSGHAASDRDVDVHATLAQVQSVLTPAQFDTFKTSFLAHRAGEELMLLINASRSGPSVKSR